MELQNMDKHVGGVHGCGGEMQYLSSVNRSRLTSL
jgi:hypothetical protein